MAQQSPFWRCLPWPLNRATSKPIVLVRAQPANYDVARRPGSAACPRCNYSGTKYYQRKSAVLIMRSLALNYSFPARSRTIRRACLNGSGTPPTYGVSRVDLGERRSSPTYRRELQRRRPTPCRSGASKGWARNPTPSSSSLWPDPAQRDHTPSLSREWCIAAKLACRMSRRHPLTFPKAVSALHRRFFGNCLSAVGQTMVKKLYTAVEVLRDLGGVVVDTVFPDPTEKTCCSANIITLV